MTHLSSEDRGCLRVAVLAGGESHERPISLKSGAAVAAALRGRGHEVSLIDPAEMDISAFPDERFDIAFLALHGQFGEDGYVQELLEQAGMAYTGSDADVSRLAFSKSACKERLLLEGVPTPCYVLVHQSDNATRITRQAQKLGYPLVVKPDTCGSSLGISVVRSPDELPQALTRCFHYDSFGILEAAIGETEWTLGMLDGHLLPLIRIESPRPLFDYEAKYADRQTAFHFEFNVPSEVIHRIREVGRTACDVVGTRGIARVDMRLDRFGQPWVLEVNTIPGLTEHSLIPQAAARMGLSLGVLCEQAIDSALRRFEGLGETPDQKPKAEAAGIQQPSQHSG